MDENAGRLPAGENVLAVLSAEAEGGALRRGLVEAGSGTALGDYEDRERARAEEQRRNATGDAARWPAAPTYWLVLTERHLHVFEGSVSSDEAGPGASSYARERIAAVEYRRRFLVSKLTVRFSDGSSIDLDVGRQKVRRFVDEIAAGARGGHG